MWSEYIDLVWLVTLASPITLKKNFFVITTKFPLIYN